jgi:hypothetical protein
MFKGLPRQHGDSTNLLFPLVEGKLYKPLIVIKSKQIMQLPVTARLWWKTVVEFVTSATGTSKRVNNHRNAWRKACPSGRAGWGIGLDRLGAETVDVYPA